MRPCEKPHILFLTALFFTGGTLADAATQSGLQIAQIDRAATNVSSLFLDVSGRVDAVGTFLKLVQIKGISGQEQAIREEVKKLLTLAGANELSLQRKASNAPLNLVMEIPATGAWTNQPGILLNAHLDTIAISTPEHLSFDPETGDFFHQHETDNPQSSSFGGDDRSGVAVIVEAIRVLRAKYWSRGVDHRRIVLVFTADEERGCHGAKYLSLHHPEVFTNLDITLSMDGPLDFRSTYPQDLVVAVVLDSDSPLPPYKRVLGLIHDFCDRAKIGFRRTQIGLGMGDFAYFPEPARAGLHLRSPVRGFHSRERVKVRDLINHVDLMCFLLLGWDHPLPAKISPENLSSTPRGTSNR